MLTKNSNQKVPSKASLCLVFGGTFLMHFTIVKGLYNLPSEYWYPTAQANSREQ